VCIRHQLETVAQATGDNLHRAILADSRVWVSARDLSDAAQSTHEDAVRGGHVTHKGNEFLSLALPGSEITGFQVHVEQTHASLTALHINHLDGVIRGKQRCEQRLGKGL
jgi:hypothetical protein